MPNQANVKFDDLEKIFDQENKGYEITPYSHTNNLIKLSDGDLNEENKDNFYYGGQPRLENSRIAVGENAIVNL